MAARNNVDPKKLGEIFVCQFVMLRAKISTNQARILRFLATNYIFKEVTPDVFANNLISSCLDTGKTFDQIKSE